MHGRYRSPAARPFVFLLAAALGCADAGPQPADEVPPAPTAGPLFDAAATGTVRGRVTWAGDVPTVPPLVQRPGALAPGSRPAAVWPNPYAPTVDPRGRGVGDVVVFLRGVDPKRARAWNHPPVEVVMDGQQFHVRQGDADGLIGFVRRGDVVTMVSRDSVFHALHAGGAAFFSLPFPDPGMYAARRLNDAGEVELTSAAGYFWMRARLFVDDQPYYARTDAEGHFTLTDVPPGTYEAVCRLPDWRERSHERDPESSAVVRLFFLPAREEARPVEVKAKETAEVVFALRTPR